MAKQTFQEIRSKHPSSFLLLLNYEGVDLPDGKIEIVAAEEVQSFKSGEEMIEAYQKLRQSGKKVMFCTPEYTEHLIIEKLPGMRVFG